MRIVKDRPTWGDEMARLSVTAETWYNETPKHMTEKFLGFEANRDQKCYFWEHRVRKCYEGTQDLERGHVRQRLETQISGLIVPIYARISEILEKRIKKIDQRAPFAGQIQRIATPM